jgi:predicted NBD/HSP70 family sugar kinase
MALPAPLRPFAGFLTPQNIGNLVAFLGPETILALLPLGIAGIGAAPGIMDWIQAKIREQFYEQMRREIRAEVERYMAWERERLRSVIP